MPHSNHDSTGEEIVKAFGDHAKGKTSKSPGLPLTPFIDKQYLVVITGPSTGGIGAETAKCLAKANAKVIILAGRNEPKSHQ
jgi:3-oxoacyl-ACP reductase-like protein